MVEEVAFYTIENQIGPVELKERKSKFLGFAFPVQDEDDIQQALSSLREQHPQANHHCYAWRLGRDDNHFRANDDGEPRNSAGMPIYRQLQGQDITQALVVVVRYFGGTKLGVGGLIQAYGDCAAETLKSAHKIPYVIQEKWTLYFSYDQQSRADRLVHSVGGEILQRDFGTECHYLVRFAQSQSGRWQNETAKYPPLRSKQVD